jgi:two-component system sensor histidine kinase TctE
VQRPQSSLFGEILDWMLAPLLLLWPMSLALTWAVAQTIAHRPYDRELQDAALLLARQATQQLALTERPPGIVRADLERVASGLLRTNDEDELFFQVLGVRGEFIAGDTRLPVPEPDGRPPMTVSFHDALIGEEPVRVAVLRLAPAAAAPGANMTGAVPGAGGLVQVAQTLHKRSHLATEIIKGVILPQFVILPAAVLLVWLALARGIRPLAELQQRIRSRDSTDLSPIPERGVPDEVAPLVQSINDLLRRLDRTMATQRHFLADAAHQLKTPLAGLRMQAELAMRQLDSGGTDSAAVTHSLRQIALSTQRAAHVVNQLLAMARAEDTGQAMRLQPVDLAALTRAVVRDFVPQALEAGIDLGYEGPAEVGLAASTSLLAEPVLMGEMVRNLVDNALRYTPRGGTVTARVRPEPAVPAGAGALVLQVEDTGPGIAPAERERVFQPFYRALGTQVEGSGLGLAIVREIAQHHGATVALDDVLPRGAAAAAAPGAGPGARFTVRFPLPPGGIPALPAPPREGAARPQPARQPRLRAGAGPWTSPSGP